LSPARSLRSERAGGGIKDTVGGVDTAASPAKLHPLAIRSLALLAGIEHLRNAPIGKVHGLVFRAKGGQLTACWHWLNPLRQWLSTGQPPLPNRAKVITKQASKPGGT
jgi:hypothetical protein